MPRLADATLVTSHCGTTLARMAFDSSVSARRSWAGIRMSSGRTQRLFEGRQSKEEGLQKRQRIYFNVETKQRFASCPVVYFNVEIGNTCHNSEIHQP